MSLAGKRVIVTGGSSGIGLATARELTQRGAHVGIVAREAERLGRAARSLSNGTPVLARELDVTDAEATARVLPELVRELGGLDVLVCNAGASHAGAARDTSLDTYRALMDVNYFGAVHATQALLPHFARQGHGHIAAVSSVAGFLGVYGYTAYAASKHALTGYMETLRQEHQPHGVTVTILFPGDTDTPQLHAENASKPEGTWVVSGTVPVMSAEQVAKRFVDGIERRELHVLPGMHAKLTHLLARHVPRVVQLVIDRQLAALGAERAPRVRKP